ncbi:hypothetical protein SARC_13610 [Sphaeroforma arctica JP610]|uniref:Uncharacterized protein n=1 Tax=Sphaeroforma arctica JP610 TaxID=667725 RepID=A0A0L0FAU5_9EUKA|nr:hypothetical protein SARC_13610 [Sphaeroforma arctica JP610]KNC73832.1 hypothetical protein SARC_13610 [Sphaeroforma arctica JP610]|eukprot:XP_014147734.1 hypothetical protein SARC_13610 [Sphaeroforma arctica JP610]
MDWFNKSIKLTKGILSQNNGGVATSTNTDIVTDTVTDTDTNAATSIDPDTNEHTHTSRSVGTAHGTASGALWSSDSRRTDKGTKSATKSVTETKTKTETGIGTHPLPPALQCIYDRAVEAMAKDLVGKHNHGGMKDESLHDSSETSDTDVGLSNSAAGRSSTYSGRSDSHAGEVVTNGGKPAECTTAALESSRTFDCFSGEFLSYAAQHSTVHAEADVGVLEGVRDELHVYVLQLPASRSRDGRGEAEEPPGIETGRGRGQLRRNETLEGLAYICGLLKCLLVMSECGINQRRIASSQTGKTVLTLLQWAVAQVTQSGQSLVPDVPGQTVARSTNSSRVHTDPQDTIRPANGGVETGSDTDRRDSASAAEGQHVGLAVGEMALLNEIVVVSMRLWQRLCGVSDRTRTRAHAEKGVRVPQQGRQNTWDANTGTESGTGGQGAEPSDAPAAEDEQVWLDGWSERTFGVGVFGCKASNPLGLVGRMCGSDSAQTGTQAYTQIRRHTHSPVRAPGSSQIHAQPQPKGSDMSVVFDTGPVQPTQSMPYPAEVGDTAAQGCDEMSGHGTARRCEDELIHGTCERVSCTEAQGIRYNHAQVMDMLVACVELWEGLASVHAAHGCIGTHADVHGDTQTASRTHTHTAAEVLCGTSPPPPVDVHEDVRDTAGTSQTHTTHTPQLGSARTASVGPSRTHITQTEKLVYTPHVAVGTRQLWRESLFTAECMGRASYYDVATECVVTMATCLANGEQEQRDVFAVRGGWQKLIQTIGPRGHTRGLIPTREQAQSRVQTRARSCMDIAEGTRVSLEVSLQLLVVRFVVVFACEAEYVVGQRVVTNQMAAMEQCGAPGTNDIPLKDGGGVGDESYLNEALSSHLTRLLLWVSYQDHTLANTDARLHAGANDGPACGEYRANPPTSNTNSNGLLAFGRSGISSVMWGGDVNRCTDLSIVWDC